MTYFDTQGFGGLEGGKDLGVCIVHFILLAKAVQAICAL